ncbi:hypothetical protein [Actinomyces sp.]|nr:hypothetical protein [Actinomyces sp.]MDO4901689.1 hypothetical protein [Actinomyces sp.]
MSEASQGVRDVAVSGALDGLFEQVSSRGGLTGAGGLLSALLVVE